MVNIRKKYVDYLIALMIIVSLNFMLPRLMPGDPLEAIYGGEALLTMTTEVKAELAERFGLDKSLPEQFATYLLAMATGNLGYSYYYHTQVSELVFGALPWTILLVGLALVISTVIGFALGLEAGWSHNKAKGKGILTGLMFLNGFPDFFIAILLLLIFGVTLGLFPLAGAMTPYADLQGIYLLKDIIWHLALPLLALVLAEVSACFILTRASVISILGAPYILCARAKGLTESRILYRHVGRNSILPVWTRTGTRVGRMITGALFIEVVFAYPGIGTLIYNSLLARDYPVIQGTFFIVALVVLICNMLVDYTYKKIDPRVV